VTGDRLDSGRWFKRFGRGSTATVRLFCFHHAGGTASMYREWPHRLPSWIEPVAVQLPGRADRFRETPYDAMRTLVDALADVIAPQLDRPYACYGLSMGARVAWALAHRLREQARSLPIALFVASTAAPSWPEVRVGRGLADDDLIGYLRELDGTPPEIFAEPDLLVSLLRTFRADLTLVDSFRLHPARPLDLPIHAFAGADDVEGPPERMRGWGDETSGPFTLDAVAGGHFFAAEGEQQVIRTIADELRAAVVGGECPQNRDATVRAGSTTIDQ
jgi:medium-chain acyl-[acyl-carrier-protein] hydrolase